MSRLWWTPTERRKDRERGITTGIIIGIFIGMFVGALLGMLIRNDAYDEQGEALVDSVASLAACEEAVNQCTNGSISEACYVAVRNAAEYRMRTESKER